MEPSTILGIILCLSRTTFSEKSDVIRLKKLREKSQVEETADYTISYQEIFARDSVFVKNWECERVMKRRV